ncbi:MAG: SurA N-terminal domain-containing protein [Sphingomonadaceae bacterium]
MISFFRGALRSPIVLGLFALILIAFAITSIERPTGLGSFSGIGDSLVRVGNESVSAAQAERRVRLSLDNAREERPGLDMLAFANAGGVEGTINSIVDTLAVQEFARTLGMAASKRQIDGQIASIPSFKGPTGNFDPQKFRGVLQQRGLNESDVRADFGRGIFESNLRFIAGHGVNGSAKLVTPYASLILESRVGQVAFVRAAAVPPGAAPTDADINTFYSRNLVRYTVPETRVVRYALFDRSRFEGKVKPTEAEIAAAYKAKASDYAATEKRTLEQVIVQSETSAKAIAEKAKSGVALATAAKAAGSEATLLDPQDQSSYAGLSSGSVADAVFKAAKGSTLPPLKSPLGWHVVRVVSVQTTAAKPLTAVRKDLEAELSKAKVNGAIADFVAKLEEDIDGGSTFDDVVKSEGLTFVSTPAVTAGGIPPSTPGFKGGPELPIILKDAFQEEADADAAVATISPGQAFALYDLDSVNAAAPRPIAAIKAQVTSDFIADRASRAAKKIAETLAANIDKGMTMAAAIAKAGVKVEGPQPIGGKRQDIARAGDKVPPPLGLLFGMAAKRAKTLEAPGNQGWFVVYLDQIKSGDPAGQPGLIPLVANEFKQLLAQEYSAQLIGAIRTQVGTTRNAPAIAKLKASLTGAAPQ